MGSTFNRPLTQQGSIVAGQGCAKCGYTGKNTFIYSVWGSGQKRTYRSGKCNFC